MQTREQMDNTICRNTLVAFLLLASPIKTRMFLAFKKYGVSSPYDFGDDDVDPSTLSLDPVDVALRLKPAVLRPAADIFPWLLASLLLISDLASFEALFINVSELKINYAAKTADAYYDHLRSLKDFGLLSTERSGRLKFISKYFAVSKKPDKKGKVYARAIFNGRALSRHQRVPAPVNLPEIPTVLREAASIHANIQERSKSIVAPSVYTADIRHYFHQIEVIPEITVYFGILCRGEHFAWRGLPMGWSHSPRIAQTVSWAMVLHQAPPCLHEEVEKARLSANPPAFVHTRDIAGNTTGIIFIWYDNITCIIYDNTHFRQVVSNINSNRKRWQVEWSDNDSFSPTDMRKPENVESPELNRYPAFLGVQLRVEFTRRQRDDEAQSRLVWKVENKFLQKLKLSQEFLSKESKISRRKIAKAVGLCIWVTYVYCTPLLSIRDVIDVSRRNCPRKPGRNEWDKNSTISLEDRNTILSQLNLFIADASWHSIDARVIKSDEIIRIVSDSSDNKGAFVSFADDFTPIWHAPWTWSEDLKNASIFLKELLAITIAIEKLCRREDRIPVHVMVDNSAAGFVIARGFSTNNRANEMLNRIFARVPLEYIRVTHIRSADNAADPLTRNKPLCELRNKATILRFQESENGWPKMQYNQNFFKPRDDEDGESDSDFNVIRHRESDECDETATCTHANFDSEDECYSL